MAMILHEVDLKALYTELRRAMASCHPEDFGPEKVTEPRICVKDMTLEDNSILRKVVKMKRPNLLQCSFAFLFT